MQKVIRQFAAALLTIALLCTINAHLPVLQTVAWAGMIVSYSQRDGLATAIETTFDGQHPCKLCRIVEQAQTKPHTTLDSAPLPPRPLGTPPEVRDAITPPSAAEICFATHVLAGEPKSFPPPVPPPRNEA